MELTVVKNATCTFCGCVCDDIELHSDGTRITHTKAACVLGVSWFKNHTAEHLYPDALVDGKPATVDEAVALAADLLYQADLPLVYGIPGRFPDLDPVRTDADQVAAARPP